MMTFSTEVDSPLAPAEARMALIQWFQAIGYRPTSPGFMSEAELVRNSMIATTWAFNAKGWHATITISCASFDFGSRANIVWKVWLWGQIGSRPDFAFWRRERDLTRQVAMGETPDIDAFKQAAKENYRGNLNRAALPIVICCSSAGAAIVGSDNGWNSPECLAGIIALVVTFATMCIVFRHPRTLDPNRSQG